jgi:hypothetical protein
VEQGKLAEAQADLDTGTGNTWGLWGLLPYVEGKLALARGDRATALEKFQYAEATLGLDMGPVILQQARQAIATLGGVPLTVTPQPQVSTPIPTPLITATPKATSTFYFSPTSQP